ncbi:carboxymuconolactone decarboxylase family protein [Streptomyces sp. 6N106]
MKIRASQINGCAFCPRMYTRDALKKGGNSDRIAVPRRDHQLIGGPA